MQFMMLLIALLVAAPADFTPPDGTRLEPSAVIANEDEPGDRMIIRGVVFAADGKTPAVGVIVHAYQTDDKGHYDAQGRNPSSDHRLKAWVKTDDEGRYEFRTIWPAPYPGGGVPAHVHYVILSDESQQRVDLYFVGDPYLREGHKATEGPQDDSLIRPIVEDDDGILHVVADLKLKG